MLMLYLFKVEVFDLGLNYSYNINTVVIAGTREDRGQLLRRQFEDHNGGVVKRHVLLGARALTLGETRLLAERAGTRDRVWLMTRVSSAQDKNAVRPLPHLYDECDMLEIELLDRTPEGYDSTPLMEDQYMHSVWFSKAGSAPTPLQIAA